MKSKPFSEIVEESEFNSYQILMTELDSTLKRMRYISLSKLTDAYEIEQFNRFWNEIKNNEAVVVSINDNTDLYEISNDISTIIIVLSEDLNNRMIIFDVQDGSKLINKIMSC